MSDDPARIAAEKIVRVFSAVCNMHVNDILPDIEEACASKDAEIERLRVLLQATGDERDTLRQAMQEIVEKGPPAEYERIARKALTP